ncbi:hypothetical protein [Burkholderia plantarii]|uniref:hypothetical protein n=1 Tax=Burkholderia plantarii TaxID=41899 RepID=UPI0018DC2356|nr:hypothetical protein [Burkholderia plantarii]MBI0329661.1 hypothetical protein [Burkholderia plantarii]
MEALGQPSVFLGRHARPVVADAQVLHRAVVVKTDVDAPSFLPYLIALSIRLSSMSLIRTGSASAGLAGRVGETNTMFLAAARTRRSSIIDHRSSIIDRRLDERQHLDRLPGNALVLVQAGKQQLFSQTGATIDASHDALHGELLPFGVSVDNATWA